MMKVAMRSVFFRCCAQNQRLQTMAAFARNTLFHRFREYVLNKTAPHPRIHKLVNHEAGPFTVFFWAPTMKWALVVAGLADLQRPVESVSIPQTAALAGTGLIWCHYSMVIIPKNWNLFSVNLFVAMTGLYQMKRLFEAGVLFGGSKSSEPKKPESLPAPKQL